MSDTNFGQLMCWMREAEDESKDLHRQADMMDRHAREMRGQAVLADEKAKLFRELAEGSLARA